MEDISKVGSLDTASKEMKVAIEAALEKVKLEIESRKQALEGEIEKQTHQIKEWVSQASRLPNIY